VDQEGLTALRSSLFQTSDDGIGCGDMVSVGQIDDDVGFGRFALDQRRII
jgi:hypothetical protein